ncbi:MarR family transcriptional regulator [Paenibacillus sp. JX-17]|uniref:MarR family transcriptional regulator n=1 Tax=Paenibacillus lacisoli TaxID=3064525 RepID=A0ABT9C9J0_9BACL|nr:MarR family transcriptional regulator [Paenibacillus sp. JX-17]MDO7905928.1 MarR family transcriptional regulator [Paenibacillus sp. JX-17]
MESSPLFEQSLGFRMGNLYRRMSHQVALRLKPHGITPEQWSILFQIHQGEGVNQKQIAQRAAKDQPTTARLVDMLSAKNLVRRVPSPDDRRAYLLYLTDAGKQLIEETMPTELEANADFVRHIPEQDIRQFWQTLIRIEANLTNMEQQGEK